MFYPLRYYTFKFFSKGNIISRLTFFGEFLIDFSEFMVIGARFRKMQTRIT